MTNQRSHRFGSGLCAGIPGSSRGGWAGALLATLGLLVSALPALAAEIVEVRVGRHPTFTRVVFELDRPAGYRIERSDPSSGAAELVVSLEASSIPRSLDANKKSLIQQVEIEPQGRRSIARVKLTKDGLRLKEMILASPPRIVLDLLNDEPVVPVAKSSAPAPKPSPVAVDTNESTTSTRWSRPDGGFLAGGAGARWSRSTRPRPDTFADRAGRVVTRELDRGRSVRA